MKTIKSLLFGLLLTVLSFLFIGLAVRSTNYATTTYQEVNSTTPITFETTFIIMCIIQLVISILLLVKAVYFYKKFFAYYDETLENKRDNNMIKEYERQVYEDLYKRFNSAKTLEDKHNIIRNFYNLDDKRNEKNTIKDFEKFLKDIMK